MTLCRVSICDVCCLAWEGFAVVPSASPTPPRCFSCLSLSSSPPSLLSPCPPCVRRLLDLSGLYGRTLGRKANFSVWNWKSCPTASHGDGLILMKYSVSSPSYQRSLPWWGGKGKDLDEENRNPHPATYTYFIDMFAFLWVFHKIEIVLCTIIRVLSFLFDDMSHACSHAISTSSFPALYWNVFCIQ